MRSLLLAALWATASAATATPPPTPLRLVVGEMAPYAMSDSPTGPGTLVELTQELGRRMGASVQPAFYPWKRALAVSLQPRTLVLPLTRTAEREPNYRWLVKLYKQKYVFIGRRGHPHLRDPEQLKHERVVVVRGTPHGQTLQAAHFSNVSECATIKECMRMVRTGIADATYGADDVHHLAANADGNKESEFDFSPVFRQGEVWLAGSTDFSEDDGRKWRAAFDAMRADGTVARILRKYGASDN